MARRAGFAITVTAVDQATSQLDKINRSIARMTAPAEQFNRQVAKFGDVAGVNKLTDSIGRVSGGALEAFRSVDRLAGALGLMTGVTSIAGIVALANRWQAAGHQINVTAANLGVGVSRLTALQGAARLAGVSAEDLSSGLKGLGETLRDATFGRNSDAIQMFQQLGIEFQTGPGKVRAMTDVLPELADKIKGIQDPFTQARIATTLFGGAGDALLPFLRQGRSGIAALTDEAKRYGNITEDSAKAASDMHLAIERLKLAGDGLANAIMSPLAPAVTDVARGIAEWTAANREWLATDFVGGVRTTATEVNNLAQQLGGWKEVGEDLLMWWGAKFLPGILGGAVRLALILKTVKSYFELGPQKEETLEQYQKRRETEFADWFERNMGVRPGMLGRLFTPSGNAPTPSLSSDPQDQVARTEEARSYFSSRGYTSAEVAGILANIRGESSFDPNAYNPAGGGEGAQGIGQWRGDRIRQFRAMFGRDPRGAPFADQLRFMDWELNNTERRARGVLRTTQTPEAAAEAMTRYYSRPEPEQVDVIAAQRAGYARAYANQQTMPAPPVPAPVAPGAATPGASGRVEVDINLRNAPPGTTATATAGGIAVAPPPRVAATLPFGGGP